MSDIPDDELASAYVDGELSDAERARAENDPKVLTQIAALRSIREALRSLPADAPAAGERDEAIRAALDARVVADLRAHRPGRLVRVLSVAAAVLVVAGLVGLVLRNRDDSTHTFSTAAGSLPATTTVPAPSAGGAAGAATADASSSAFSAARLPLGAFADRDALVAALQSTAAQSSAADRMATTGAAPEAAAASCSVSPPSGATGTALSGSATLAGQPVQVDVFTLADGTRRLVVTAADCSVVFSQPI